MTDYSKELELAKNLAHDAGKIMLGYFNSASLSVKTKSDKTLVTQADIEINGHVLRILEKETPGYSVWGEEQSRIIEDSQFTWACDPIDGTVPFSKGLPISTFSLALVNKDGESVLGVIYDPFQDRLFEAVRGGGAFLNGQKISVSNKSGLDGAFVDNELWYNHLEKVDFEDPRTSLGRAGAVVTSICSACIAGCLVAKGDFEAMFFGQGKPEDIAALAVIIPEAGGKVTDLFGNDQRYDKNIKGAIVSNGLIHDDLVKVIGNINYTSKYL